MPYTSNKMKPRSISGRNPPRKFDSDVASDKIHDLIGRYDLLEDPSNEFHQEELDSHIHKIARQLGGVQSKDAAIARLNSTLKYNDEIARSDSPVADLFKAYAKADRLIIKMVREM